MIMKNKWMIALAFLVSISSYVCHADTEVQNNTDFEVKWEIARIWGPTLKRTFPPYKKDLFKNAYSVERVSGQYLDSDGVWKHICDEAVCDARNKDKRGHWTAKQTVIFSQRTDPRTGEPKLHISVSGGV